MREGEAVMGCVVIAVIILLSFLVYNGYQKHTERVYNCSYIGEAMNSHGRIYKCPDGSMYIVDDFIRNAKGE
jgi:hypothetical protein